MMRIKKARTLDLHEGNERAELVFREAARASFSQKGGIFVRVTSETSPVKQPRPSVKHHRHRLSPSKESD
jgi:hypothetical protein